MLFTLNCLKLAKSTCIFPTRYWLDGQGVDSRLQRNFPQPFIPVVGPSDHLQKGYRVSFPGVKQPGRGVNRTPPTGAKAKERNQLYLHLPSGP
jgi:hypothetical protein